MTQARSGVRGSTTIVTLAAVGALATVVWFGARPPRVPIPTASAPSARPAQNAGDAASGDDPDDKRSSFRLPTGAPASLTCDEARRVITQVHEELAYAPPRVRAAALADGAVDWLDPHGLWSATPGSPVAKSIDRRAAALEGEIEGKSGPCTAARAVGDDLVLWIAELTRIFDAERAGAASLDSASATTMLFEPIGDGASSGQTAQAFAAMLGRHVGAAERALGPAAAPYVAAAHDRFLPSLDGEGWARAVLAALVRAYVPIVDPHGAWAPLDEESSVYEVDLDARPPVPLWDRVARTALGARVEAGALAPLRDGDVVVSLAGIPVAGLPMEQIDQLAVAVGDARVPSDAVVLRPGEPAPRALRLRTTADEPANGAGDESPLPVARVPYGDGDVAVIALREVKDDLGEQMTRVVVREKGRGARPLAGFVLDLRGNGGGSTDGASATLGLFLPGATLFPLHRRDGTVETERAPEPPLEQRWAGPVATIVDGNTASAAEMIAGALAAYRRGPMVGKPTYGKGCAQEYQNDDAQEGVLRITTLLYALPDGSAVQRVGLTPTVRIPLFPMPGEDTSGETEAKLEGAPPTWRGPDVRDPQFIGKGPLVWPSVQDVGPCDDADVCRALRALASGGKVARVAATGK